MKLRSVDLNLLVILEALIDEVHVSRAAARLGLSQPATSGALERCRTLFNDPLLERVGGGMRLTAKAEALRNPLRSLITGVADIFGEEDADIAQVRQTVRVAMADVLTALCVPALCEAVRSRAPGIDLVFYPWSGGTAGLKAAERGAVEIVLSGLYGDSNTTQFHVEDVVQQEYVVAMRWDHPVARSFDLQSWLEWPHAIVSSSGARHAVLDEVLAGLGRSRRVGVSLPSFLLVPEVLRKSDFIGMLPSLCVTDDQGRGLTWFRPPIEIPGFMLKLAWHRRHERDVAVQFVCCILRELLKFIAQRDPLCSSPQ